MKGGLFVRKAVFAILITCLLFGQAVLFVQADIPPPPDVAYKREVDNGNKIFVMIPDGEWYTFAHQEYDYVDEEYAAFFDQFPQSGLYINEPPYEAVYLFDKYGYLNDSWYLSNDGRYIVYISYYGLYVILFYEDGQLLRSYKVEDLLKSPDSAPHTTSYHVMWEHYKQRVFDDDNKILTVVTFEEKTISFDITTGKIIEDSKNILLPAIIVTAVVCLLIIFTVYLYKKKRT